MVSLSDILCLLSISTRMFFCFYRLNCLCLELFLLVVLLFVLPADPQQHGFLPQEVQLPLAYYNLLLQFTKTSKRKSNGIFYVDFSKAFVRVHHSTLLAKLKLFGFNCYHYLKLRFRVFHMLVIWVLDCSCCLLTISRMQFTTNRSFTYFFF